MKYLLIEKDKGILKVGLNRPDIHNAFNAEMIREIAEVFSKNVDEDGIKAVALYGEGKSFCAGADINWMKSMVEFSKEENERDSLELFDMFAKIRNSPVPVIALVHGNVFGGGLGLVAASDIVFAETESRFCFSEVKIGLVPAVISPFVLQKVSETKAKEWMLTGKLFGADEALNAGLVNGIESGDGVKAAAEKTIGRISSSGKDAVLETKKLIHSVKGLDWPSRRTETARVIAERRVSEEGQEGLRAFLEKRAPIWSPPK